MPFLTAEEKNTSPLGPIAQMQVPESPTEQPRERSVLQAALETENALGSAITYLRFGPGRIEYDPDFDPMASIRGTRYADHATAFGYASSAADVVAIKRLIDREEENRRIVADAGGIGFIAEFAAGVLDPINLVPIGGATVRSARLGQSILRGAASTGAAGVVATSAAEYALLQTQYTRTGGEAAANIAVGTFLAAVLGGAAPAVRRAFSGRVGPRRAPETGNPGETSARPFPAEDVAKADANDPTFFEVLPTGRKAVRKSNGDPVWGYAKDVERDEGLELPVVVTRQDHKHINMPLRENDVAKSGLPVRDGSGLLDHVLANYSEIYRNRGNVILVARAKPSTIAVVRLERAPSGDMYLAKSAGVRDDVALAEMGSPVAVRSPTSNKTRTGTRSPLDPPRSNKDQKNAVAGSGATGAEDIAARAGQDNLEAAVTHDLTPPRGSEEASQVVAEDLLDDQRGPTDGIGSVGAAEVSDTVSTLMSAGGVEKAIRFSTPGLRAYQSRSNATRKAANSLVENPMFLEQNAAGIASPVAVESLIRQYQGPLATALSRMDELYADYRGFDGSSRLGRARANITGQVARTDILSAYQFREEIGRAMRRGDEHAIQQVAEAARTLRQQVFEPLKKEAIRVGLLDADVDVKTAESYLSRVYNTEKIIAQRDQFQQTITDWLVAENAKKIEIQGRLETLLEERDAVAKVRKSAKADDDVADLDARTEQNRRSIEQAIGEWEGKSAREAQSALKRRAAKEEGRDADSPRLREADKAVDSAARRIRNARLDFEPGELRDRAGEIIDRIVSTPDGRLPYEAGGGGQGPGGIPAKNQNDAGVVKGRVFAIPDMLIEDFLESDVEMISHFYNRTLAPDVEITRRFGDVDMTAAMQEIRGEYDRLTSNPDITEAERRNLTKQRDADIRDLAAMRDRILGTYAAPADPNAMAWRINRQLRNWNTVRLLGGMTISAFADAARPVMVHGMSRVLGRSLASLSNGSAAKLAVREARMAGTALDMVLDSRAQALAEIGDQYGRHTRFERGSQAIANKFSMVALMAPWNAAMKSWTAIISGTRILEESQKLVGGGIHQSNREYLALLGIDRNMADRIARQASMHGERSGGVWGAGTEAWTDREAVRTFRSALAKDVDRIIVTPGAGDRPLWMSSEMGKTIGQFKSFAFASSQRVLIAGLQQKDGAALQGAIMMIGLGYGVYALKTALAGREISTDPAVMLTEGIDRSGITGWFFDANNILEKATRGAVGVSRLHGGPMMSRYASRNIMGAILGPSVGTVQDAFQTSGAITSGDMSAGDVRAMRRLIPYQNLFYMRGLFDQAEAGVTDALGAKQ